MITLKSVQPGQNVRIVKLHGEGPLRRRFMDMGLTSGTEILVKKYAPLGDPVQVSVRGSEIALRKADIGIIEIESPEAKAWA